MYKSVTFLGYRFFISPFITTCKKSEWDSKKGRVKSNSKTCNSHNRLIISELHKVETKLLDYQRLGIPYTAKYLLSDKNNLQNANSLIFKDIMERMLEQLIKAKKILEG